MCMRARFNWVGNSCALLFCNSSTSTFFCIFFSRDIKSKDVSVVNLRSANKALRAISEKVQSECQEIRTLPNGVGRVD